MDKIKYQIPNDAKYFSTVRLTLSGILNLLNRNIEEIEDLKMAVTESLNIAQNCTDLDYIDLVFEIEAEKNKLDSSENLFLAKTIIESLVDECYFDGNKLILSKKL